MKKIITLLIAASVALSCMTGCAVNIPGLGSIDLGGQEGGSSEAGNTGLSLRESEPTDTDDSSPGGHKTAQFDDLEGLAQAAALCYHTAPAESDTGSPEFAWNTAGWYAAYKANVDFSEEAVLTADQVSAIQTIFTGASTPKPPAGISAEQEERDGETCWVFPEIYEEFNSYLGVIGEIMCNSVGDTAFTVTIRDHLDDETKDATFRVVFQQEKDGYNLAEFVRDGEDTLETSTGTPAGGAVSGQEITLESLQQANLLSNLFSQYDTVVYTEDYPRGFGAYTYIIETDTGYTLWHDYNMSGYYNEFFYSPHADEPDRMTAWPVEVMPEWLDDFVGDTLLPTEDDEIIPMESSSGETVFYIESSDYDDVDIVYTVDSETLVLKTIERMNDSDESLSVTTFRYGEEVELPETVTAWQGELRTITLNFLDEDAAEVYQIPANWEFNVDDYCPWSAAYLDEACTQPYEYPGDGTDYTIYLREEAE